MICPEMVHECPGVVAARGCESANLVRAAGYLVSNVPATRNCRGGRISSEKCSPQRERYRSAGDPSDGFGRSYTLPRLGFTDDKLSEQ